MKVNAGGIIATEDIIGRDEFIINFWRILANQSVVLTSERRIGKSCVVRKMCENPPENWDVILRDVEGISTLKEFVSRLVDDLYQYQPKMGKGKVWFNKLRKELDDWSFFGLKTRLQAEPPPFHINARCFAFGVSPLRLIDLP